MRRDTGLFILMACLASVGAVAQSVQITTGGLRMTGRGAASLSPPIWSSVSIKTAGLVMTGQGATQAVGSPFVPVKINTSRLTMTGFNK